MTRSDPLLALLWALLVGAAFALAVLLRRRGVSVHRIRDLLHVGAGLWVFGWPAWDQPWLPVAVPWVALGVVATVPWVARRSPAAAAIVAAVTSAEERWTGLVLYTMAFALLTTTAFATPVPAGPAAVALLALAWGDGLGGAVGSHLGRGGFRLPWAKRKTWLGAATVAAGTIAAALAWVAYSPSTGVVATPVTLGGAAVVAAIAEAAAPRTGDNLAVPAAVFLWLLAAG